MGDLPIFSEALRRAQIRGSDLLGVTCGLVFTGPLGPVEPYTLYPKSQTVPKELKSLRLIRVVTKVQEPT